MGNGYRHDMGLGHGYRHAHLLTETLHVLGGQEGGRGAGTHTL